MKLPSTLLRSGWLCWLALAGAAHAQNEVYVCTSENGTKEYRNTSITRNCKKMDLPGGTFIPAPPPHKGGSPLLPPRAAISPAEFPRVDSSTQKARDADRRQILQDEMNKEEQKLASLRKDFNNGEPERNGDERNYAKYQERVASMRAELGRTEKNVEALRREISNLK
jgi:hypothetical protein